MFLLLAATLLNGGCVGVAGYKGGSGNPPPVTVYNPTAANISSSGATITWTTNVPADSQVDYGITPSYGQSSALNPAMVTSHSVALSGLTPSTVYHYRVRSKDAAGNQATSGDLTFTTASGGNPPVISGVTATNVSTTGATVSWITDKPADSQVDYGPTTSYGSSTPLDPTLVTTHSQGLSGLTPGALYHYQVKSKDGAGNQATSGDFTFTTLPDNTPPVISGVTATGTTVSWITDKPADSQVDYGTTTTYGSSTPLDPTLVTTHSQGLSGLTPGTLYHYRVKSRSAAGFLATSGDNTFTAGVSDFQTRCSSPGVIKCVGFDTPADIAGRYGDPSGITTDGDSIPTIDNTLFASGGGSLKFTVPPNSGANTSGSYFTNFSNDLSVQFDSCNTTPNQCEFYIQWRQRFSPEFITTQYAGGEGWKQDIITEGDRPGTIVSSCQDIGVITQNQYHREFPQMYHSCGVKDQQYEGLTEPIASPPDFYLQNGIRNPGGCTYSLVNSGQPYRPPCIGYKANQWMTFQIHIKVGTWYTNNRVYKHDSTVQLWVAEEGKASQLVLDFSPHDPACAAQQVSEPACQTGYDLYNGNIGVAKYGKIWLLPYNTGKNFTVTYPTAYTWYDELIISRQRIPDPQ